jgi:mono/diheme cytochrome c family protein
VVVGLLAAAVLTIVMVSKSRQARVWDVRGTAIAVPSDPASLEEGHRLFRARGCAECHGENGAGTPPRKLPPQPIPKRLTPPKK